LAGLLIDLIVQLFADGDCALTQFHRAIIARSFDVLSDVRRSAVLLLKGFEQDL
jgi:hypothetical protein